MTDRSHPTSSNQTVTAALRDKLEEHANARTKEWWENYVKDSAPFHGVPMPTIRKLLRSWYEEKNIGLLAAEDQTALALLLIRELYTEDKLAGILLLQEMLLPAGGIVWRRELPRFARLFDDGAIADWNICDWFSVKVLGPLVRREGTTCAAAVAAWRRAPNLWRARASVVPFVTLVKHRSFDPQALAACSALIRREERFAKTAVGWLLRELSRENRPAVRTFVREHADWFSAESLNNALKYFPKAKSKKPGPAARIQARVVTRRGRVTSGTRAGLAATRRFGSRFSAATRRRRRP